MVIAKQEHPDWIFGFWTGGNPMSANRQRCWKSFERTGLNPILITPESLSEWIVPEHPFHPTYDLLSPIHRSDYLRSYFMYHHGGGYADIKEQGGSWIPTVDRLRRSSWFVGAGYREIRGGAAALDYDTIRGRSYVLRYAVPQKIGYLATFALRAWRPLLIGNCAFYFKRRSSFARKWLAEAERRLDMLHADLMRYPPSDIRDRRGSPSGYPIPWQFIMGDIIHPLAALYTPRLMRTLPRPAFEDYM